MPVELGHLQEQVAAGDGASPAYVGAGGVPQPVGRVEATGQHQPLHDRAGDPRAVPEVAERVVGPGRDDPVDLGLADALDLREREPDAPPPGPLGLLIGPPRRPGAGPRALGEHLHGVVPAAAAHVEAEHLDAAAAGVLEDEALGVHAGVVGEHPGQEVRRPVRLEPGRLEGRQREGGGMGLAEPEGGEGLQHRPDLLHHVHGVAAPQGAGEEPHLGLGHALAVPERAALLVGLREGDAGETADDLDDLLVEDHDPAGGGEDRAQVVVEVARGLPALLDLEVGGDHVALDRPGTEQ